MKELIQTLTEVNAACNQAQPHLDHANELQQEADTILAKSQKAKRKWTIIGIVGWFILSRISGLIGNLFSNIPVIGSALRIIIILIAAIGGGFLAYRVANTRYKREKETVNSQINDLATQRQAELDRASAIFNNHNTVMSLLPSEYWYPMATGYLLKAVQTGRATTLGEAIDKYEEQLHRWKIEEANAQMVAQQEQQTAHLKSIRTSNKINAAANVTNAFVNIASKF